MKANHVPGEPKGMVGSLLEEQINNSSSWFTDDHIRALLLDIIGAGINTQQVFISETSILLPSFFANHSRGGAKNYTENVY